MTGGRAVILGATGRNFAAGMSGGIAFVLDPDDALLANCNMEMVLLERVEPEESEELRRLIENHRRYTGSEVAERILEDWEATLPKFTKVLPIDYKRALLEMSRTSEPVTRTVEAGAELHIDRAGAVVTSPGGQR